jgi:hypothetical protein
MATIDKFFSKERQLDSLVFLDWGLRPKGWRGLRLKLYEKLYFWLQERVPRREPGGDKALVDLHWVDGGFVQNGTIFGDKEPRLIPYNGLNPKRRLHEEAV